MSNLRAIGTHVPSPPEEGYAYPEKYVAFLDILGFSDLVERADEDPELRKGLARGPPHLSDHLRVKSRDRDSG